MIVQHLDEPRSCCACGKRTDMGVLLSEWRTAPRGRLRDARVRRFSVAMCATCVAAVVALVRGERAA